MFIKRLDEVLLKEYRHVPGMTVGEALIDAAFGAAGAIFVVDDGKLSDISTDLVGAAGKLENYNSQIYTLIANLASYWSGPSYDAFVQKANSYKDELENLPVLFGDYSKQVGTYSKEGSALISKISALLEFGAGVVGAGADGYSSGYLQNINARDYYDMPYRMDGYSSYGTHKEAKEAAEQIRTNLYNDMEVLQSELINIEVDMEAIKIMYPLAEGQSVTDKDWEGYQYYDELSRQHATVTNGRDKYAEAINQIDPLLHNRLLGYDSDGLFVEGSDWGGNYEGDDAKIKEGINIVNDALSFLDPVYAICERTSNNGLVVGNGENTYANSMFYNKSNVSNVVLEASYNSASSTETSTSNPNVTYFNSRQNILDGYDSAGFIPTGTGRTFSELDAYGAYEPNVYQGNSGSYDSVRIDNGDGTYSYMTYDQYQRSSNNGGNE